MSKQISCPVGDRKGIRGAPFKVNGLEWLNSICLGKGKSLAISYSGVNVSYPWECSSCLNIFNMRPYHIKSGSWCPKCGVKKRTKTQTRTLEELHDLAKGRGKCLSNQVCKSMEKCWWECNCGYKWQTPPSSVQQGTWCPKCSGHAPVTYDELLSLPKGKGICLSKIAIPTAERCWWQCNCGKIWMTTPSHIKSGKWCPRCAKKESKPQQELYRFVKNLFPDSILGQRGILPNKRFELDIWIPSLKKAIEFDGPRHDPNHVLFDSIQTERDGRKNKECLEMGIQLLRITFDQWHNKALCLNMVKEFLK